MAITGVSKSLMNAVYRQANKDIEKLEEDLRKLKNSVENMNQNVWYGGQSSIKWYQAADTAYISDVKFAAAARNLQTSLNSQIKKIENATK